MDAVPSGLGWGPPHGGWQPPRSWSALGGGKPMSAGRSRAGAWLAAGFPFLDFSPLSLSSSQVTTKGNRKAMASLGRRCSLGGGSCSPVPHWGSPPA